MITKVNIADKFRLLHEHWSPRLVATVNDTAVKLVKIRGEFVWHHHDDEDELFLVVRGNLRIELRDGVVMLGPGELVVIPRGVEHRPVADEEVEMLLVEPATTLNTGNAVDSRTRHRIDPI